MFTDTEIWISCSFHVLQEIILLLVFFLTITKIIKKPFLAWRLYKRRQWIGVVVSCIKILVNRTVIHAVMRALECAWPVFQNQKHLSVIFVATLHFDEVQVLISWMALALSEGSACFWVSVPVACVQLEKLMLWAHITAGPELPDCLPEKLLTSLLLEGTSALCILWPILFLGGVFFFFPPVFSALKVH